MNAVTKGDWKLFQERVGEWQERYIDKLNQGYIEFLSGTGNPSSKFWELARRINEDKHSDGVLLELEKKNVYFNIAEFLRDGTITRDDLADFSNECKESVEELLQRF